MKKQLFLLYLVSLTIYLTVGAIQSAGASPHPSGRHGTHSHGVIDDWGGKQHSDQYPNRRYARSLAANLNVGEPREVRMIYFLPNDWEYRPDVVQKMKDTIRTVQTFYAEQMEAHGYGRKSFRVERDAHGEPKVHRVDGQHPFSHYDNTLGRTVRSELEETYDFDANIYFIVLGTDALRQGNGAPATGVASQYTKNGGFMLVPNDFSWSAVAHELGHTFGLSHDFRDGAYIMSYGPGEDQLSACAAEFLSVHPYFNSNTPIEEGEPPTIELISSPLYPAGSQSVRVQIQVKDSDGLHQVILFAATRAPHFSAGHPEVKVCHGLADERDRVVTFDYDGVIPSADWTSLSDPTAHPIRVEVVDKDGDVGGASFTLAEISPYHIATLLGHTDRVLSVSFSPDGTTLASGPRNGTVKLWDVATRANITTLWGHASLVKSVVFSPDGRTLASGSWDGTVKLWDVATRTNFATLEGHTYSQVESVAFSPDGTTLASVESNWINGDGAVKLWDVATRANIATLPHTRWVESVAFSPDGITLASVESNWANGDGAVKLWDVTTRTNFATLYTGPIESVSFSPDGTTLASGTAYGKVELWDVATRANIATLWGHASLVESVVFSPDGRTLASGSWDGTVELWDVTTRTNFATFWHIDGVRSVSFSPDGGTLASGTNAGTVELWDMSIRVEAAAEIDVPDPNLRTAIAEAIGVSPNTPILRGRLAKLTRLEARNANISNLTGLESATNLRTLYLNDNSVSDFSPLRGLTKLRSLHLRDSNISDISTMVGLPNLTDLSLNNNSISDISAVSGLPNLRTLYLNDNSVSDFSPLRGLTKLRSLYLQRNNISDISTMVGLPNLTDLSLNNNSISDISAVSGLPNLRTLHLDNNSVSDISAVSGLTNLTDLSLWSNNITDISPLSGLTNLRLLHLSDNSVSDISAVSGLTNLRLLYLSDNSVSDISAVSGLTNLTWLHLSDNSVSDISAVSGLTNLRTLYLSNNSVSDISAVSGLTNLTDLSLWGNNITDISPLSGLTHLTRLSLGYNAISDVAPLLGLTNLTGTSWDSRGLRLGSNPLSYASINTHIPAIQMKGIEVEFDNRVPTTLLNISGVITASDNVLTVEVRDSNGRVFEGVPVTFTVTSGGGTLSVTSATTDKKGRAQSRLTLGSDTGSNRVKVSVVGVEQTVTFSDVADGVHIPDPNLRAAIETALSKASGTTITAADMATLTELTARNANISDLTGLEAATNLRELYLADEYVEAESRWINSNSVSDLSPLSGLTNLTTLHLQRNVISDISPLARVTNLTELSLGSNAITAISALSGLTKLRFLYLQDNTISDLSSLSGLTNLTGLYLYDNNISDLSPLVTNTGLGSGDEVNVNRNPLNYTSINTHIPALRSRGVVVRADNLKPTTLEFLLSVPAGISLIHVPLKVTAVDGVAKTIESIADLYDALGGAATVNYLATYGSQAQEWRSYFVLSVKGSPEDVRLTDATGISANLSAPVSIRLSGDPLGTNGTSAIVLNQGLNLVGLPLKDSRINRVSDLLRLDGILGNVPAVTLTDGGEFKEVKRAGYPSDIAITGGQAFLLTAQRAATVHISGAGWYNGSGTAAAPLTAQTGIQVTDTTPMLALRGSIVDEDINFNRMGFRVIVKNRSTGRAVAAMTRRDGPASRTIKGESVGGSYQVTVVDVETGRAAKIGDTLEISVRSPSPLIGVQPVQYTVTVEDVKRGWIQLPALVAYEIPKETVLLANYPNPFNPETWIPYRLAEDADVKLTIYDANGHAVRTIDVGHRIAAVYESRSKAIYWDGRNNLGERMSSGIYFYHLSAGRSGLSVPHRRDYSQTRKMLILK